MDGESKSILNGAESRGRWKPDTSKNGLKITPELHAESGSR